MQAKHEITENWIPRYTGLPLVRFGINILFANSQNCVGRFAEWRNVEVVGRDKSMPCPAVGKAAIINLGMGGANAAIITGLLSCRLRIGIDSFQHLFKKDVAVKHLKCLA